MIIILGITPKADSDGIYTPRSEEGRGYEDRVSVWDLQQNYLKLKKNDKILKIAYISEKDKTEHLAKLNEEKRIESVDINKPVMIMAKQRIIKPIAVRFKQIYIMQKLIYQSN